MGASWKWSLELVQDKDRNVWPGDGNIVFPLWRFHCVSPNGDEMAPFVFVTFEDVIALRKALENVEAPPLRVQGRDVTPWWNR